MNKKLVLVLDDYLVHDDAIGNFHVLSYDHIVANDTALNGGSITDLTEFANHGVISDLALSCDLGRRSNLGSRLRLADESVCLSIVLKIVDADAKLLIYHTNTAGIA